MPTLGYGRIFTVLLRSVGAPTDAESSETRALARGRWRFTRRVRLIRHRKVYGRTGEIPEDIWECLSPPWLPTLIKEPINQIYTLSPRSRAPFYHDYPGAGGKKKEKRGSLIYNGGEPPLPAGFYLIGVRHEGRRSAPAQ